jgi:hypothetical protein
VVLVVEAVMLTVHAADEVVLVEEFAEMLVV